MGRVKTGGGWRAILYTLKNSRQAGGLWKLPDFMSPQKNLQLPAARLPKPRQPFSRHAKG